MRAAHAVSRDRINRTSRHPFLILLSCLAGGQAWADSLSDRLIMLQSDGRSYVEQHGLISDDQLLVVPLPTERTSLEMRFSGPEWLTFASAHERSPDRLSLWSGSALTRFRHRYGEGLAEPEPGVFQLNAATEHAAVQSDDPASMRWSISWMLPDNARLLDFGSLDGEAEGRWSRSGPLLTYQQSGGILPPLTLRFSLRPLSADFDAALVSACRLPDAFSDACSPDVDGDEIPDYRDICLPVDSQVTALATPQLLASRLPDPARQRRPSETPLQPLRALGCDSRDVVMLSGIRFRSGQSYLDVAARTALDRVARALQRLPDTRFEISTHTDNAGRVEHNQALSETRARTIRHYLGLRGVAQSQIVVRGLGETSPAYDNAQAAGRRANRRVELRAIEP